MLTEPLPNTLDVRKAAARGVTVNGTLDVRKLQRLRPLLATDEAHIDAEIVCSRDEEGRYLLRVSTVADLTVVCQRCLESMPLYLTSDDTLAIVWTDDQAERLPRHLDPLVVDEQDCNLWELVEEGLMLALPSFTYHDAQECKNMDSGLLERDVPEQEVPSRPNPFNVLAQLKPGHKQ